MSVLLFLIKTFTCALFKTMSERRILHDSLNLMNPKKQARQLLINADLLIFFFIGSY